MDIGQVLVCTIGVGGVLLLILMLGILATPLPKRTRRRRCDWW